MQSGDEQPCSIQQIQMTSDLKEGIERNFHRLEQENYHTALLFRGNDGWPGDLEGRAVLALTLLGQCSNRLPKYLDEILNQYPKHMNEKGYFGPIYPDGQINEQQFL